MYEWKSNVWGREDEFDEKYTYTPLNINQIYHKEPKAGLRIRSDPDPVLSFQIRIRPI